MNTETSDCKHWSDCGIQGGGCCDIGRANAMPPLQPSFKTCIRCEFYEASGLGKPGDALAAVIKAAYGFNPCGACQEFKQWMNKLGWTGCWRERHKICTRLVDEAARRGIRIDLATVESLIGAAIRVWLAGAPRKL